MLIKFIYTIFILAISSSAEVLFEPNRCTNNLKDLTEKQKNVILKSFSFGAEYDLGYTMAAIAWQESCAGEYRVNFQDPSAGIYHAYIPSVMSRYPKLKNSGLNQNIIGDRLINDDDFAAREALKELQFWKKVHSNNWKNIIKSYNRGYSWQKSKTANAQAERYFQNIKNKVDQIREMILELRLQKASGRMLNMPIYKQYGEKNPKFKLLNE